MFKSARKLNVIILNQTRGILSKCFDFALMIAIRLTYETSTVKPSTL